MNTIGNNAQGMLKSLVERIERHEEEKKTIAADIKDIFIEAKGNGFDTKALRRIIAERKKDMADRKEARDIFDTYAHAVGLYDDLV